MSWIKVDGNLVYKAEAKATDDASREDLPASRNTAAAADAPSIEPAAPAMAASF